MKAIVIACLALLVAGSPVGARGVPPAPKGGGGEVSGNASLPNYGQAASSTNSRTSARYVITRTVDCGAAGSPTSRSTGACAALVGCAVNVATRRPNTTRTVTLARRSGTWVVIDTNCNARSGRPQLSVAAVYQEFRKRVPSPAVGIAPKANTLVNIETVMWVDTPRHRSLATVTLLGYRIDLSIDVASVSWRFGDGQQATTTGPQRAYTDSDPCNTAMCSRYWGHVYTTTGPMTVSAQITWRGTYRVNGGPLLAVPQPVTGPAATASVDVHESRGVLVAH